MKKAKLEAIVQQVRVRGIHKWGTLDLPDAYRVEIELEGSEAEPCMMYRYTADGEFCGDTWHESFEQAIEQATYEYGLGRTDFRPARDINNNL